mmetsp:Transcript_4909/g.14191  ORF Transcript_4909/g.14191 Transcript_4909/m.14191 type:complete len:85 (-) Transcript_4909:450-704(-)
MWHTTVRNNYEVVLVCGTGTYPYESSLFSQFDHLLITAAVMRYRYRYSVELNNGKAQSNETSFLRSSQTRIPSIASTVAKMLLP